MLKRPGVVVVTIAGVEYQAPALNLAGVIQIEESKALELRRSSSLREKVQGCLIILCASLNRNYPDITVEQLTDTLEASELQAAVEATAKLLDQSGFAKVAAGAKASGEAKAGDGSITSA